MSVFAPSTKKFILLVKYFDSRVLTARSSSAWATTANSEALRLRIDSSHNVPPWPGGSGSASTAGSRSRQVGRIRSIATRLVVATQGESASGRSTGRSSSRGSALVAGSASPPQEIGRSTARRSAPNGNVRGISASRNLPRTRTKEQMMETTEKLAHWDCLACLHAPSGKCAKHLLGGDVEKLIQAEHDEVDKKRVDS